VAVKIAKTVVRLESGNVQDDSPFEVQTKYEMDRNRGSPLQQVHNYMIAYIIGEKLIQLLLTLNLP